MTTQCYLDSILVHGVTKHVIAKTRESDHFYIPVDAEALFGRDTCWWNGYACQYEISSAGRLTLVGVDRSDDNQESGALPRDIALTGSYLCADNDHTDFFGDWGTVELRQLVNPVELVFRDGRLVHINDLSVVVSSALALLQSDTSDDADECEILAEHKISDYTDLDSTIKATETPVVPGIYAAKQHTTQHAPRSVAQRSQPEVSTEPKEHRAWAITSHLGILAITGFLMYGACNSKHHVSGSGIILVICAFVFLYNVVGLYSALFDRK